MTGNASTQQLGNIAKIFYRFMGLLGLVSLLVACGTSAADSAARDVVPAAPTTNVATQENVADPENVDERGTDPSTMPTAVPTAEAMPTPEVDPTRQAVSQFDNYSNLTPEEQDELVVWAGMVGLGDLGLARSFRAVNGSQVEVIGDWGPESAYQLGDRIVKMDSDPGFFVFTAKVVGADGSEVDVSEGYTLYMTNDGGSSEALVYAPGTTVYWIGPDGQSYRFDSVTEEFYTPDVYEELIEVREAQAAGFDNVVSSEYDEVTGLTYGLDANGNRVAVEDETGWKEYLPPVEGTDYAYGPDGESVNTLEGEPMPDAAHTFTFSIKNGWQQGFNLNIPNGISPVNPDVFFSSMESDSIINAPQAIVNLEQSIGQNGTIDSLMASVILGYGQEYYANAGMTFNFVYRQTFFRGSNLID